MPSTKRIPSPRSCQWPRLSTVPAWSRRAGILSEQHGRDDERRPRSASTRDRALRGDQYAAEHRARSSRSGSRPSAGASSRSAGLRPSTRFGIPAYTAGRKKPVAIPASAASTTIAPALSANGSAQKTATRTRSDATSRRLRESRSTSGPSSNPITMIGRKSAIRSALTHVPDPVRSKTSTVSASAARYVPAPEPSVARRRRRSRVRGVRAPGVSPARRYQSGGSYSGSAGS